MRVKSILACLLLSSLMAQPVNAQRGKDDQTLDVYIGPSLTFRLMTGFKVPANYAGTRQMFSDSLNKADRPGQNLSFGAMYTHKTNALEATSIGLAYTTLGWRRVLKDLEIGDDIHPKVGYVSGLVGAGGLQVNQNYRYHYAEASYLWHKSAEGYTRNLKEFDLWYFFGFSAAALIRDRVFVETLGFTYNEKSKFSVQDDNIRGFIPNVFLNLGYRADYYLYKRTHALLQPRLRIPLMPSGRGDQTVFLPQFSLEVGLMFKLTEDKK